MPKDEARAGLHNIEAEQALLGSLLLNNDGFEKLPAGFEPEMFFDPVHALIFEVAQSMIGRGDVASPVTLKPFLASNEGLRELGGWEYLVRLAGAAVTPSEVASYARSLRSIWARRSASLALGDAQTRLNDGNLSEDPSEALEALQSRLATLAALNAANSLTHSFSEAMTRSAYRMQEAFKNEGRPLISTGLHKLDAQIGGLMPSDHVVLVAESSMGKTALGIDIAWNVAKQDLGVFIGSLEMPAEQIAFRIGSRVLADAGVDIPYNRLMNGRVTEQEFRRYLEAARSIEDAPVELAEDDASSLPRLVNAANAAKRKFEGQGKKLGLVVIDYLQQVNVPSAKSDYERVSAAARGMKTLAKQLQCPVISLCQMNNDNKGRKNKRPFKSDVRGSGEIEEAADVLIGVYRHSYYLERDLQGTTDPGERVDIEAELPKWENAVELIIMKQRRGPITTVKIWGDLPHNRFLDRAPGSQEAMAF